MFSGRATARVLFPAPSGIPLPPNLLQLPAVDAPRKKARILIVDDVESNLKAMEAVVDPLGQELVLARSGDEALKHLLHDDFALILMDVQMPGLDGLETARLIRARERTRHIPLIFVTALSREAAYVMRGYAEGAVDYLLKPIDPDILRSKVSAFVELYLRGERLKEQALELATQRQAHDELQRTTQLEQQLVAIVGHDLRTPLSSIQMTAESQLHLGTLAPPQVNAFGRIVRGTKRIKTIVDALLDFTRARLGGGIPIARTRTDLAAVARTVLDELRTINPERHIRCELPEGELVGSWDGDRLAQVISNLLDNAVKYSPVNSQIVFKLSAPEPNCARLQVHNEGEPIPPELQASLFEPFRRARSGDGAASESLGLGLFIAAFIVRAHGGTISVRSEASVGTEFDVCLPSQELPASQPHPIAATANG